MNTIITPVTADNRAGFDSHGQFWISTLRGGYESSSIYADVRGHECLLCGQKWEVTGAADDADKLADQYKCDSAKAHVHKSCYVRHLGFNERIAWIKLLSEAGIGQHVASFTPVTNQYGGAWDTPWYSVGTDYPGNPVLIFGPRKRVDSISLEHITKEQVAALRKAFETESTTQEHDSTSYLIHAWDQEAVMKYFVKIHEVLNVDNVPRAKPGFVAVSTQTFDLNPQGGMLVVGPGGASVINEKT